jgi:hypothetical protein
MLTQSAKPLPVRYRKLGEYGLSVFTLRFTTTQGIAHRKIPHDQFCMCRAATLRKNGFKVCMTDDTNPGHATIFFPREPTIDDVKAVIALLTKCRMNRNPAPSTLRRRRRR